MVLVLISTPPSPRLLFKTIPHLLLGNTRVILETIPHLLLGNTRVILETIPHLLLGNTLVILETIPHLLLGNTLVILETIPHLLLGNTLEPSIWRATTRTLYRAVFVPSSYSLMLIKFVNGAMKATTRFEVRKALCCIFSTINFPRIFYFYY